MTEQKKRLSLRYPYLSGTQLLHCLLLASETIFISIESLYTMSFIMTFMHSHILCSYLIFNPYKLTTFSLLLQVPFLLLVSPYAFDICTHMCFFYLDSVWEKTRYLSFWVCLISLNMRISTSIHLLANDINPIVYIFYIFFIHLSTDKHLGWLYKLAIVKSAAVNMMSKFSAVCRPTHSEAYLYHIVILFSIFILIGMGPILIHIIPHNLWWFLFLSIINTYFAICKTHKALLTNLSF